MSSDEPTRSTPPAPRSSAPGGESVRVESLADLLPPADVLARYNKISPEFADRLLRIVETQAELRHRNDELYLKARIADAAAERQERRRGQWFGFVTAMTGIVAGAVCAYHGAQVFGTVIGGATLIGLATVFMTGAAGAGVRGASYKTPSDRPGHETRIK